MGAQAELAMLHVVTVYAKVPPPPGEALGIGTSV